MCRGEVNFERVCVPGDGGEADLAEEKRPVLNQLGVESAVSREKKNVHKLFRSDVTHL